MKDKDVLKLFLGKLKYQRNKMINTINIIDDYINRIEANTSEIKCEETYRDEEYKNKDLKNEVIELLRDLKCRDDCE